MTFKLDLPESLKARLMQQPRRQLQDVSKPNIVQLFLSSSYLGNTKDFKFPKLN